MAGRGEQVLAPHSAAPAAPVPAAAPDRVVELPAPPAADDEAAELALLDQVAATGLALPAVLESLLLVADGAVEPAQLARACGVALATVEQGLADLAEHYRTAGRGLRLQERAGRYQLVTAPETGVVVEAFLQVDVTARLSGPALETLAVIAYRQPVTRAQVEAVRGVDCSGVLRSLMQRGLIEETGRLEAPGRPVLYGITELFLNHFGLTTLRELPPLAIDEQDRMDEVLSDSATAQLAVSSGEPDPRN
ncbi:MAG: SMC-Scp complex subunit ScpB [Caldilineaceae bacterium]|nr:SMC-Scp complex subunit ScpB [Caldilineaceae bacterium]